jgi:TatD DNase family protein
MTNATAFSFIDSHAHLNLLPEGYESEKTLSRAMDLGLEALVNVGTDIERSRESIELARKFGNVFATVGLHPGEAHHWSDELEAELDRLAASEKVVAIGETGLDFAWPEPSSEVQIKALSGQIRIAVKHDLPLVIHARDAFTDLFQILKNSALPSRPGVFHCFTGDLDAAKNALDLGFYLSFSGIITFKNAGELRDVIASVPIDRILVETDCPYLAPVPHRGKTNEPAFIPDTLSVLIEKTALPGDLVSRTILKNTKDLFKIP